MISVIVPIQGAYGANMTPYRRQYDVILVPVPAAKLFKGKDFQALLAKADLLQTLVITKGIARPVNVRRYGENLWSDI